MMAAIGPVMSTRTWDAGDVRAGKHGGDECRGGVQPRPAGRNGAPQAKESATC